MAAKSKKNELLPRLIELNLAGMTLQEASRELGIHPVTASGWLKQANVKPVHVRTGRREDRTTRAMFTCEWCSKEFEDYARNPRRFCSLGCTNAWQKENRAAFKVCPCGERITLQDGATHMYTYRKYCSDECRAKYRKKRQSDPDKQITFNCGTCGKEVTRWKGYGPSISGQRFCDRTCAAKHTKTVRHYVVRESDMVLDSTWEMLLAGLLGWHKISISRVDRTLAITTDTATNYAPDFLVGDDLWVEVKGNLDTAQRDGWHAWRQEVGRLAVVDRLLLEHLLRVASNRHEVLRLLEQAAHSEE